VLGERTASITFLEALREMQLPAPLASQVFNNLGLLYKSEGRLRDAREALEQDVALCRGAEDASGQAIALLNAASVIALQHGSGKAVEYADRAAGLFAKVGAPDGRERATAFANQLRGPPK
jgi:tetratricopeptide (TPR) repeat protein